MSPVVPRLLVPSRPRHGVTVVADRLRAEVGRRTPPSGPARGVHVHFTDRLYGRSASEAARWFTELARHTPTTVTLHDVPQGSDGARLQERAAAYRRVALSARGVVCNSRHERRLLADLVDEVRPAVIPLPVDDRRSASRPDQRSRDVALLGFFYPGKGHAEVVAAVAHLPAPRPRLLSLGGASEGHEDELAALVHDAATHGVDMQVTGYLPDAGLLDHARRVAVPVVAHQHVSASGSWNSWLAAGRRPLVRDGAYAREMAALRPGSGALYDHEDLAAALELALADPESTWLPHGFDLRPSTRDVADAYLTWWSTEVPW